MHLTSSCLLVFPRFLEKDISQLVRAQGKWHKKGDDCRLTVQRANWASWNLVRCPKHALPLSVSIVTDNTTYKFTHKWLHETFWDLQDILNWYLMVGLNTKREPTYAVVHNSFDVLPSGADQGSCAHKCVCYNFLNRREKCRK